MHGLRQLKHSVVTANVFNKAMGAHPMYGAMIDGSGTANDSGIYRNQRSLGAGRKRCHFYFVTVNLVKGKQPTHLAATSDWIAAYDNNRDRVGLHGLAVSGARVLSGGSVRD
jgi:hypothetical protein